MQTKTHRPIHSNKSNTQNTLQYATTVCVSVVNALVKNEFSCTVLLNTTSNDRGRHRRGPVYRLGDSGVNRLGDTSAFVNTAGQILLTRRGMTRMNGVGIVFELYTAPFNSSRFRLLRAAPKVAGYFRPLLPRRIYTY